MADVVLAGAAGAAEVHVPGVAGVTIRKDTRQKGPGLTNPFDSPPCPEAEAVLAEIRKLAAKRADGLMTSEQVRSAIRCNPSQLDAVLRELERQGSIVAAPGHGPVAIIILADSDEHALRRSVRVDDFARREEESREHESAPAERADQPSAPDGATPPR